MTKIYKTLKVSNDINKEKEDINKTLLSIVDEIYVHYLYIYNNYIFHNQRKASNASSFFESLLDLFYNLYQHTEKQFKNYYELFTENINILLSLVDLKVSGNLFEGQISYDKVEKKYMDLNKKTSLIYEESIIYIKKEKKNIENNMKMALKAYFELYCKDKDNNNEYQLEKLENKINQEINNFIGYMNFIIGKFNDINRQLNILNIKTILNNNAVLLNRNNNRSEEHRYEDNIFIDLFKGIVNIFISIGNRLNEKEEFRKNLIDFERTVKNKLDRYEASFNKTISSIKDNISISIKNNMMNVTNDFDKIRSKRKQYEQIKNKFYNIIYPENTA